MVGFKRIIFLLLIASTGTAIAQNNTNSPYTRFGYGELSGQNFGNSKAMGGIAFGLRDASHINPLNPASYTAVDSLTFLFEGGISLQNTNFNDNGVKKNAKNSSFDYVAMAFRLNKHLMMSLGMLPYSNVGYVVSNTYNATASVPAYLKQYNGDGGLHQFYAGLGLKLGKRLSVGANMSYFWGDITRSLSVVYNSYASGSGSGTSTPSYSESSSLSVRNYKLDFGLQYMLPLNKKQYLVIGAAYTLGHNVNNTAYFSTVGSSTVTKDTVATFGIPNSFGFGVTFNQDKKWIIGLDASLQKWSKTTYFNQKNAFCDRMQISMGAQYTPDSESRYYSDRINYRLGAYYLTPYYKTDNGERASREFGVSAGFGFPLPRTHSYINISGQYSHVKGLQAGMVNENIFRLNIGLTFNERWFFKRKVD